MSPVLVNRSRRLSLIGLLDDNAHVTGSIKLGNEELIGKTDEEMSELRGTKIS